MRRAVAACVALVASVGATAARAAESTPAGPPELPGEPLAEPFPWWLAGVAALGAAAGVGVLVRRRGAHAPAPGTPRDAPVAEDAVAAARAAAESALAALRDAACADPAAVQAWHDRAAAVLRTYVAAAFGVGRPEATTEELLADAATAARLGADLTARLGALLRDADLVKFACDVPDAARRAAYADAATALVRESAGRTR